MLMIPTIFDEMRRSLGAAGFAKNALSRDEMLDSG